MKTNCPFCNAPKLKDSGIWDFFGCGTDVDRSGKPRQSFACTSSQRDNLLSKIVVLEDKINELEIKLMIKK